MEEIRLSTIVRFVLPGLVAVGVFGIIPIAIYHPDVLDRISEIGGAIGVSLAALGVGFVVDGLKLYQLSFKYNGRKHAFMQAIADELGADVTDGPRLFAKAAQLERARGLAHIDFMHSRWVLSNATAKLLFGAGVLWLAVGLALAIGARDDAEAFLVAGGICLIISLRLLKTSDQEQTRVERLYVSFCKENRTTILKPELE